MIMPVVADIALDLRRVMPCPLHQTDNPCICFDFFLFDYYTVCPVNIWDRVVPLSLSYLRYFVTSLGVNVKNTLQHFPRVRCQNSGQLKVPRHYFFVEFIGVGVFKRQIPAQHGIKNDTTRPYVNIQTLVSFTSDHLGCSVTRRPTGSFEFFTHLVLV